MKQCPICKTKFKDTTMKCRYCNERLVTISPPKQATFVKHTKGRGRHVPSKKKWSTYWPWACLIVILTVIVILGFQIIAKNFQSETLSTPLKELKPQMVQMKSPPATGDTDPSNHELSTVYKNQDDSNAMAEWNNKAVEMWSDGKYKDPNMAIEYLNHAIKLQPNYARIYYNRGIAYQNLGQNQKAIEDYTEAIRLKPSYTHAYYNRGTVYLNQGNKNLACQDYQKACELGQCDALENSKSNKVCR